MLAADSSIRSQQTAQLINEASRQVPTRKIVFDSILANEISNAAFIFNQSTFSTSASTSLLPADVAFRDLIKSHPRDAAHEVLHQKDVFSNLKSQYLHIAHKKLLLERILAFPPELAKQQDVLDLETRVQQTIETKKLAKVAVEDTKKEVEEMAREIYTAYETLKNDVQQLLRSSTDVSALQQQLNEIEADDEGLQSSQIQELESSIQKENTKMKSIQTQMSAVTAEIESTQSKVQDMQDKLSVLNPQKVTAQQQAEDAIRATQLQDKSVEEVCSWYKRMTPLLMTMLGLKSVKSTSTTCMQMVFQVASSEPEQDATLQVSLGEGVADVDAKFLDLTLPLQETIRECRHYAGKRLDDLVPLLIRKSIDLARRHVLKMRELRGMDGKDIVYDDFGLIIEGLGKKSGKKWKLLVSSSYPRGVAGGITIEACGGVELQHVKTKISTAQLHTLSQVIPMLNEEDL
ncbi:hypothetical protein SmJEL517_g01986 [Synchytrium microbalum]|uniref:Kinetochore protein Sos7 coiled-coil domain-containing protein n=1 Tax=Synchytrium microbalum TaxID=1806994 RepID=A0A507CDM6_9FUNG|nr:uncharacterized protein SmJEL517_g01986 [Synchytrium microbalum]TPX35643.1 hypothetical protein SmJEL517_g01986 [Synchytrium microbalum]